MELPEIVVSSPVNDEVGQRGCLSRVNDGMFLTVFSLPCPRSWMRNQYIFKYGKKDNILAPGQIMCNSIVPI